MSVTTQDQVFLAKKGKRKNLLLSEASLSSARALVQPTNPECVK